MKWPFRRKAKPAPITCSTAGKMGAEARKAKGHDLVLWRTRQMYREAGRELPPVLREGGAA